MWTDHLLFWAVLIWMLLLATLAIFAVRALLRDESDPEHAPKTDTPGSGPTAGVQDRGPSSKP